jgi:hypothetical protein
MGLDGETALSIRRLFGVLLAFLKRRFCRIQLSYEEVLVVCVP